MVRFRWRCEENEKEGEGCGVVKKKLVSRMCGGACARLADCGVFFGDFRAFRANLLEYGGGRGGAFLRNGGAALGSMISCNPFFINSLLLYI